ncbi:MAG: hypothetical protein M0P00_00880 [Bacteroidaceae bacterium]|nr:hypothetical protein [Bacteroidaceae bacterium]
MQGIKAQAEIGECLAIVSKIKEGDFNSWFEGWRNMAQKIESITNDCHRKNHKVSAREAFNYSITEFKQY